MRVLVAVYSETFNTFKVANRVREELGADLVRIEAAGEPDRSRARKSLRALLRLSDPIKPCRADLKGYDLLVLCCPNWALSPPPAVNAYILSLENAAGRKFALAVTSGGLGGGRVIRLLRADLEGQGMGFVDSVSVRARDIPTGAYFAPAEQFAARIRRRLPMPAAVARAAEAAGGAARGVGRAARLAGALGRLLR